MSSPVKQKEYRLPDGRKRIIPEAVGVTAHQERMSVSDQSEALEWPIRSIGQNNNGNEVIHINSGAREGPVQKAISGSAVHRERPGVTAWATISESLVIEKVPASVSKGGGGDVERIGCVVSGSNLLIRVFDKNQGETLPVCLEAHPREHAVNDILGAGNACTIKETELSCTKGSQNLWSDRISGKATVLAGNSNFWVVGCEDGSLQVYTKCGRRAMPTMMMGSAAVFIDCDESWKLMLVTRMGSLYVWDLFNRECLLHDSLVSLINTDLKSNSKDTGTVKVISAKLAKSGSPLVVLATRHAYLFDMSLKCWLRVADDCFPASNFASSWNLGSLHGGELAALQVDVRKFQARKPGWTRVTDDGMQTRAHLEALLASALALRSPCEYRQCLLSYIRFLAREADESRLREVCESFLGPPIGMTESASDLKSPAWDPLMLGMDKHKLLREDILPAMASNRKVQRLLNEFMDLLSEYETVEPNIKQKNLTPEPPLPPTDKMDLDTPALDKPKSDSVLATTQTNTIERAVPGVDHSSQTTDQTDTVSSAPSQVPDSISEDTNPVQTWSTPSEQMDLDPPA